MIKKIKYISILMIVAELLLAGFVIQWLLLKYKEEKINLSDEIQRYFKDTQKQVIDSVIVFNLFTTKNKHLKSTSNNIHQLYYTNDKDSIKKSKTNTTVTNVKNLKIDTLINLKHNDSKETNNKLFLTLNTDDNIILKSFRLFIDKTQEINLFNINDNSTFFNKDSGLFKKIFTQKLIDKKINLKLSWFNKKDDDSTLKNNDVIQFTHRINKTIFGVEIENYRPLLIKKITPQLFFTIFLLLFTGLAFFISYKSLRQQIQLNIMRDDFVRNISHELKTPVSTVKVVIEALQNFNMKENPETATEYLEMAANEIERLELLVNKVLKSVMLGNDNHSLKPEKIELKNLVNELITNLSLRFEKEQAIILFNSNDENFYIYADKLHIQGVIINLLDNSIKYTVLKPYIEISLKKTKNQIILKVADNGIGIPKEYHHKIFDRFFRVPTGDKHNVKGYGLGLNYAQTIMKAHNANIQLANRTNGGVEFSLIFDTYNDES